MFAYEPAPSLARAQTGVVLTRDVVLIRGLQ